MAACLAAGNTVVIKPAQVLFLSCKIDACLMAGNTVDIKSAQVRYYPGKWLPVTRLETLQRQDFIMEDGRLSGGWQHCCYETCKGKVLTW